MLVDLRPIGITGQQAEELLQKVGITVNKNMIPYDTTPPAITSGIRIGVAAVTSRGFVDGDIDKVAGIIVELLKNANDEADLDAYRERVLDLCRKYPLYLEPFEISGMLG